MLPTRLSCLILSVFYQTGPLLIIFELFAPAISLTILFFFALSVVVLQSPPGCRLPERRSDQPLLTFAGSVTAFALCFAWIYYSGIGSFAPCRWDYVKHNILFSYLLEQKLPIYSSLDNQQFIVHYSVAYYITPVRLYQIINQLFPGISLNYIQVALYSVVVFLTATLLARRNSAILLTLLVVGLVGGLDVFGMMAFGVKPDRVLSTPWGDLYFSYNLDWWGVPFAPQSLTTNLYYAPQHFFGALIGTALLYTTLRCNRPAALTLLNVVSLIAASAFWSPYVAVGLTVLAVVLALSPNRDAPLFQRLRQEGFANLFAPRGLIVGAYTIALSLAAWLFLTAAKPLSPPQLLLNQANAFPWLLTYTLNYAPFILALILLLWPPAWRLSRPTHGSLQILGGCLAASAAVLMFNHGFYGDWGMRVTLPLSIALAVGLTQVVLGGLKWPYLAVLLGVLLLSSAASLATLVPSVLRPTNCVPYGTFSLKDLGELASQYEGRPDSILYRYLVRSR